MAALPQFEDIATGAQDAATATDRGGSGGGGGQDAPGESELLLPAVGGGAGASGSGDAAAAAARHEAWRPSRVTFSEVVEVSGLDGSRQQVEAGSAEEVLWSPATLAGVQARRRAAAAAAAAPPAPPAPVDTAGALVAQGEAPSEPSAAGPSHGNGALHIAAPAPAPGTVGPAAAPAAGGGAPGGAAAAGGSELLPEVGQVVQKKGRDEIELLRDKVKRGQLH